MPRAGGQVIERWRGRRRGQDVADLDPCAEVLRDGVADRGPAVPTLLVLYGQGGEQEERVVLVAVVSQKSQIQALGNRP
jgi:hypothetical protein